MERPFFPEGLPHRQELAYASRQLSSIEVNGTFYSSFKPATFAKWRDELAYLRLMRTEADCPTGYAPAALDAWARSAREWASGSGACEGKAPRDVFVYFISVAKERAPGAALALLERLK